jgi:PmbA protein
VNSNGIDASYKKSGYAATLSASLIFDDGARIDVWESLSALAPAAYDGLTEKIMYKLEKAGQIKKMPSEKVPVIASPKAFARLIGIVTAGLNAKSVYRGISPFGNKTGIRLFAPSLTISDDPELHGSPYSYPFDDEGVNARKKFLVNGGRIEKYISDLNYAHKLDLVPEGNGARGYASPPYPLNSNVIIKEGREPYSSLQKYVKKGILVDQFIGLGQSNTLTGDFSAGLDLAYLIENGEITGRVKDCMLTDNIFKLLRGDIFMSSEREQIGSVLAPYVLLSDVNYTG